MQNFKTESKRLLELMINSIYTNKEIFLRELISNASDALEKRHFESLTKPELADDFGIEIKADAVARTLVVSDNGIGMSRDELESNLGTIAQSGTRALKAAENAETGALIGQFGVGFYSVFMVASKVEVLTRRAGNNEAYLWVSSGAEGYDIAPAQKDGAGTEIVLHLKENDEDFDYSNLLDAHFVADLVRKYSDYIRFPIRMEMPTPHKGDDGKYQTVNEIVTLNSMTPLWKKSKGQVEESEYAEFYKNKFLDYQPPLKTIAANIEGTVNYNLLAFVPATAPYDFYSKEYKRGLTLYADSVLIMQNCAELLPDYLGFVKGVVDSGDLSLNISREMLQQDRQLRAIAVSLEKKILGELSKMLKNERETYEKLFSEFGTSLKFGAYSEFGRNKDKLKDLLLFRSSNEDKPVTLSEYKERLKDNQEFIYYAAGTNAAAIKKLPQTLAVVNKGMEVLYFDDPVDEFLVRVMDEYDGKKFKSVSADDLALDSDEDKEKIKKASEESTALLSAMKERLKGKVKDVMLSRSPASFPSCIRAEGDVSLEMEKLLNAMPGAHKQIKTRRILEINPEHAVFARLKSFHENNIDNFGALVDLLHLQALLLANIPLDDNAEFVELVNRFLS